MGLGEKFNWGAWTYQVLNSPLTIGKQYDLGGYFNFEISKCGSCPTF